MIINHFTVIYFLYGVVCTLLVLCAALWIASIALKQKMKKMEDENNESNT